MTDFLTNPVLWTDGYDPTHWFQYPPGTTKMYTYWMSRGGAFEKVVPLGFQYLLKAKLSKQITMDDVEEAVSYFSPYFNDEYLFNREGFEIIVNEHNGYWPVEFKFAPEGLVLGPHQVLMTAESTDDRLPWVPEYLEMLTSLVWAPTTVASKSRAFKEVVLDNLRRTGTPALIEYKVHDFGGRSVTSLESAGICGFAHLPFFRGTDTVPALVIARKVYGEHMAGNTIPAMAHHTTTPWGRFHEYEAYRNMIIRAGQSTAGLYAIVADSYDLMNAVDNIIGKELKTLILAQPSMLVVRPDSGVPEVVVLDVLESLGKNFGFALNEKGFKVLNHVRVIQGDGIRDPQDVKRILDRIETFGWSGDNVAFGCGTGLLQDMNRDTSKFAIKASAAIINGSWVEFRKEPITDPGKWSRAGRLKLIFDNELGVYKTVPISEIGHDVLQLRYRNGQQFNNTTLVEIRARANEGLIYE